MSHRVPSHAVVSHCVPSPRIVSRRASCVIISLPVACLVAQYVGPAVAIVTGGNVGLGYATVKALARAGAHVIMACRSEARATEAIARIQQELADEAAQAQSTGPHSTRTAGPVGKIEFGALDLASLASVREFTTAFRAKGLPLHILSACNKSAPPPFGLSSRDGGCSTLPLHVEARHACGFAVAWTWSHDGGL